MSLDVSRLLLTVCNIALQTKMTQDLKKVQRQLAGVTGSKDDEIERLETRVATLEVMSRYHTHNHSLLYVCLYIYII